MSSEFDLQQMRERLKAAIKASGRSMRSVSQQAGVSNGYLHSITEGTKEPGITRLANVCDAIGVSLFYVLYGSELSPETEKIIQRLEQNPEKRDGILQILAP